MSTFTPQQATEFKEYVRTFQRPPSSIVAQVWISQNLDHDLELSEVERLMQEAAIEIFAHRYKEMKTGDLKLPGFGAPLSILPPNRFPVLFLGSDYSDDQIWKTATLLIREVCMLRLAEELTNKPEWWRKVRDPTIAARWKAEALAFDWASYRPHADFTPKMADAVLAELNVKADLYEKTGLVPVMDYSATAVKSDTIMTEEMREELKTTVARLLEDVPEADKDWHPGSDGKVLDLVHPSMWPLVYGRSRILNDKRIGIDDALQHSGAGQVIPVPLKDEMRGFDAMGIVSDRFQWLPCDVAVDPETGKVKIASYINNLHPVHHADLYPIIERFIEKSLPAWDIVHRWVEEFETQRLTASSVGPICTTPETCEANYECHPSNRPLNEGEVPRDEDEAWEDGYEESQRGILDHAWFAQTHGMDLPDPDPTDTSHIKIAPDDVRASGFFDGKDRLQVIVKLANIHLTPDQPSYDGGSWHVEGMLNERIVSTALYYYDSDNVTDSHLDFRTMANREDLMTEVHYQQGDHYSLDRTFAITSEGQTTQDIGGVLTRQGRALFFPNVYMHRVSPFKLADPSRPGHRKILALFLVDPAVPIISTANVPPQQRDWWADEMGLLATSNVQQPALPKLPAELRNIVVDNVEFPIGLDEAKRLRGELMAERSTLQRETDNRVQYLGWNFCEH